MQTYAPKNTQRFKFGFGFSIFWGFEFEFEYFANLLQISNKITWNKKKISFEYGSILIFFLIFKIDSKNLIFYFILNYLTRNLQEICKKSKLKLKVKYSKNKKPKLKRLYYVSRRGVCTKISY